MSVDRRCRNWNWKVTDSNDLVTWDGARLAVLMDIRDELRKLNMLLNCRNCVQIPMILRRIEKNTQKRKRRRKPQLKGA
jgi:hypothetical protein